MIIIVDLLDFTDFSLQELEIRIQNLKEVDRLLFLEKYLRITKNNKKTFKFIEYLLLSDDSIKVQLKCIEYLLREYKKKAKEVINYTLLNNHKLSNQFFKNSEISSNLDEDYIIDELFNIYLKNRYIFNSYSLFLDKNYRIYRDSYFPYFAILLKSDIEFNGIRQTMTYHQIIKSNLGNSYSPYYKIPYFRYNGEIGWILIFKRYLSNILKILRIITNIKNNHKFIFKFLNKSPLIREIPFNEIKKRYFDPPPLLILSEKSNIIALMEIRYTRGLKDIP